MILPREESIKLPLVVGVVPTVIVSVVFSYFSDVIFYSDATRLAMYSLIAFLSSITAAVSFIRARQQPYFHQRVFYAIFVVTGCRYIFGAIEHLFGLVDFPPTSFEVEASFLLVELLIIGLFFLISEILRYRSVSGPSIRIQRILVVLLVSGVLTFYILLYYVVLPALPAVLTMGIIVGAAITSFVSFTLSGVLAYKVKETTPTYSLGRLLASYSLFLLSGISLLLSLMFPFLQTATNILQVAGLVTITLAVAIPLVHEIGLDFRSSYAFALIVTLLITLPFLVILLVELLASGVIVYAYGEHLLTHLGAAVLSGGMASLITAYSNRKPARVHTPLILMFFSWMLVEVNLIFLSLFRTQIGLDDSFVPYIIGSFVTIVALIIAIRWILQPLGTHKIKPPKFWLVVSLVGVTALLWLVDAAEIAINFATPILNESPLDRAILLVFNLIAMFLFTCLGLLSIYESRGKITIETLTQGFLALWLLSIILKCGALEWTLGWWVAEYLLFGGLLFGPVILGISYLEAMSSAETSRGHATLYSDLLIHDIGNYHQLIQSSLDLLGLEGSTPEMQELAMRHAQSGLLRAHHLIRNVRQLARIVGTLEEQCGPVDLVECIELAFDQAISLTQAEGVEFLIKKPEEPCFVLATDLLKDVFLNLLRNSIDYSPQEKRIIVEIDSAHHLEQEWWVTRIIDHGRGISPDLKPKLFERFLEGAEGTGLGLSVVGAVVKAFSGSITVEDRVPGDHTRGTVFKVTLRAVRTPST